MSVISQEFAEKSRILKKSEIMYIITLLSLGGTRPTGRQKRVKYFLTTHQRASDSQDKVFICFFFNFCCRAKPIWMKEKKVSFSSPHLILMSFGAKKLRNVEKLKSLLLFAIWRRGLVVL